MKSIEVFWQEFRDHELESHYIRRSRRRQEPQLKGTVSFGETAEECDAMVEKILRGECGAVITSMQAWQESARQLPNVDDYRILLDHRGEPRAVLRSTGLHMVSLWQMKGEYTYAADHPAPVPEKKKEASGRKRREEKRDEKKEQLEKQRLQAAMTSSLALWQAAARPRLVRECTLRGVPFSMDMLMVVDLFSVAYAEGMDAEEE
ncbi:MAG: hypothetical protein Q4C54_09410 [Clostridia bacterium]|nr:hypothetical protein [Clostridia bacterium]